MHFYLWLFLSDSSHREDSDDESDEEVQQRVAAPPERVSTGSRIVSSTISVVDEHLKRAAANKKHVAVSGRPVCKDFVGELRMYKYELVWDVDGVL